MEKIIDLGKIIKRLKLIKDLILLEEFDDVLVHAQKLVDNLNDLSIKEIIDDINLKFYSDAVSKIEIFINKNQTLVIYVNPEIDVLKIEIKKLEIELSTTSDEIIEIEKLIHDFGIIHNRELGEIVRKILELRKNNLKKEQGQSNEKKKEYEEAKKDYDEYNKHYEEIKSEKQFFLTDEEKRLLKSKYRAATKLCHPDVVTDELKEYAEIIFRELQIAYEQNNLKKVIEILETLEKGGIFISKSEGINEKIKLKSEVMKLRNKLSTLKNELNLLKETDTYQTIIKIDNWDEYFINAKQKLSFELENLEN
jgi:hypothetical protein